MKVLFVGLGSAGQRHLQNIHVIAGDDTDFIAFRRTDFTESIQPLNYENGKAGANISKPIFVQNFSSLVDALAEKPDFAVISSPTSLHATDAEPIMYAGIPIFLEKPIAQSFDIAKQLAQVAKKTRSITSVGFQLRFHPLLRQLRRSIHNGELGQLLFAEVVVGSYLPDWHPDEDYHMSYCSQRELGGGVVLTLIHELDYLYWIFGLPTQVFSLQAEDSRLGIEVDVCVLTTMLFEDGHRSFPIYLNQNYSEKPVRRYCRVVGEKGAAILDLVNNTLQYFDANGMLTEQSCLSELSRNDLFLSQMKAFFDSLNDHGKIVIPLIEALPSQLIAEHIARSIDSERVQKIEAKSLSLS